MKLQIRFIGGVRREKAKLGVQSKKDGPMASGVGISSKRSKEVKSVKKFNMVKMTTMVQKVPANVESA